jgi:hypothetical protein
MEKPKSFAVFYSWADGIRSLSPFHGRAIGSPCGALYQRENPAIRTMSS